MSTRERSLGIWRLSFVLYAAPFALACNPAVPNPEPQGRDDQPSDTRGEIVGGSTTSAFPATGALTLYGSLYCTGTLIGNRKVLTAAHCLQGVSASALHFTIGPNSSSPSVDIAVQSITPNPNYDDQQLTDDIGYVTLVKDAPIPPMPILAKMDNSWVGQNLVFVGYGITSGNGSGEGVKRQVTIPIAQVMAKQFEYQTPGKNTCNGDSGGPAFAKVGNDYYVAGITSYGDMGCQQYGVDTRTDTYASFLGVTPGGGGSGGSGGSSGSGGNSGSGGSSGSSGSSGSGGSSGSAGSGGAPSDPCHGETYAGRCDGSSVIWCENQAVQQEDCASQGKTCGWSSQNNYYACVAADTCQGETYDGRCDKNKVVWCENGQVKSLSCTKCGYDSAKGYYNCL